MTANAMVGDQEKALAKELFASDDAYIASRFEGAPLQLGSGKPFESGARETVV